VKIKCPFCKKYAVWEDNPWRPFCSERCRNLDLGKWFDEDYRVAGESAPAPEYDGSENVS